MIPNVTTGPRPADLGIQVGDWLIDHLLVPGEKVKQTHAIVRTHIPVGIGVAAPPVLEFAGNSHKFGVIFTDHPALRFGNLKFRFRVAQSAQVFEFSSVGTGSNPVPFARDGTNPVSCIVIQFVDPPPMPGVEGAVFLDQYIGDSSSTESASGPLPVL